MQPGATGWRTEGKKIRGVPKRAHLGEIHLYKAGRSLFTGSVLLFLCGNRQDLSNHRCTNSFLHERPRKRCEFDFFRKLFYNKNKIKSHTEGLNEYFNCRQRI